MPEKKKRKFRFLFPRKWWINKCFEGNDAYEMEHFTGAFKWVKFTTWSRYAPDDASDFVLDRYDPGATSRTLVSVKKLSIKEMRYLGKYESELHYLQYFMGQCYPDEVILTIYVYDVKMGFKVAIPTIFGFIFLAGGAVEELHTDGSIEIESTPVGAYVRKVKPREEDLKDWAKSVFVDLIAPLGVMNAVKKTKSWRKYFRKVGKVSIEFYIGSKKIEVTRTVYKCRICGERLEGYGEALHHYFEKHFGKREEAKTEEEEVKEKKAYVIKDWPIDYEVVL